MSADSPFESDRPVVLRGGTVLTMNEWDAGSAQWKQ
jgi:hypothetical protein